MTDPTNTAAWLMGARIPLKIDSAPYTPPDKDELVIRNHAIALNPVDHLKQYLGKLLFPWVKFPCIWGEDVSGIVHAVGSNVTRFKPGDRVVGQAIGTGPNINRAAEGAFQTYVVLKAKMCAPIPNRITFEEASVIPLGLSTAACGLFEKAGLGLDLPKLSTSKSTDAASSIDIKNARPSKTVLIWGGSTSVGSNAIQLAVAAGYKVITTCSPRNFPLVTSLGASYTFDYSSPTVISDILALINAPPTSSSSLTLVGALAIGDGAGPLCLSIVAGAKNYDKSRGGKRVSMISFPIPVPLPAPGLLMIPRIMFHALPRMAAMWFTAKYHSIHTNLVFGDTLATNEVGQGVWVDWLGEALEQGQLKPCPQPMVAGEGLESIQKGLDLLKAGVSARKVVVSLP